MTREINIEALKPHIKRTGTGLLILFISWLLLSNIIGLIDAELPLRFSSLDLILAVILMVAIELLCNFGEKIYKEFEAKQIKYIIYFFSVFLAYLAYRNIITPYLGDYRWIYIIPFIITSLYLIYIIILLNISTGRNIEEKDSNDLLTADIPERSTDNEYDEDIKVEKEVEEFVEEGFYCIFCGELIDRKTYLCDSCSFSIQQMGFTRVSDLKFAWEEILDEYLLLDVKTDEDSEQAEPEETELEEAEKNEKSEELTEMAGAGDEDLSDMEMEEYIENFQIEDNRYQDKIEDNRYQIEEEMELLLESFNEGLLEEDLTEEVGFKEKEEHHEKDEISINGEDEDKEEIFEEETFEEETKEKIKCTKCGALLKYGAIFCNNCFGR